MLRLLYLANYAPQADVSRPRDQTEPSHQVAYHTEVHRVLESLGFDTEPARNLGPLLERASSFDYVFSLLNRAPYRGSEILVSALCEYFRLPYLGARPHIRAVAEDKLVAKMVVQQLGFPVPKSRTYRTDSNDFAPPDFRGPYIAKPRCGAASKYLTENCIQDHWEDLKPEVIRLRSLGDDVLVEQFVAGTNVSLPLIGGNPPLVLPAYCLSSSKKGQLVTYEQKRRLDEGLERSLVDDPLLYDQLRDCGLALYRELQPLDYLRVDFRLTELRVPIFLEFNVCSNIGPQSGFYFCAQQLGMSYREMIMHILRHSFQRQNIDWQSF
jgi:D-alanine-D-alanine ligase